VYFHSSLTLYIKTNNSKSDLYSFKYSKSSKCEYHIAFEWFGIAQL